MDQREYYEKNIATSTPTEDLAPLVRLSERRKASILGRSVARAGGSTVLEVGCGDGYLTWRLAEAGCFVTGTDIADARLEQARARTSLAGTPPTLVRAAAEELPFESGSFDCVVCSEVLEHLPNPQSAVAEAARVLKTGGAYIVTVPYCERIAQHQCVHCGEYTPQWGHLHSFDGESLTSLLEQSGFVVESWRPFTSPLNTLPISRSILRVLPDQVWSPIDGWLSRGFDKARWMIAVATRP